MITKEYEKKFNELPLLEYLPISNNTQDILRNKISINNIINDLNIIYFLIKNNEVVYVGQSTNGLSRIYCHIKDKDFDSYSTISVEKDLLSFYEDYYIMKFQPIYNKCKPNYVFVNISDIKSYIKNKYGIIYSNKLKQVISQQDIPNYIFRGTIYIYAYYIDRIINDYENLVKGE